jgi:hypothetical protein
VCVANVIDASRVLPKVDSATLDDAAMGVLAAVVLGEDDTDALSDRARMDALARLRSKFGAHVDSSVCSQAVAAAFTLLRTAPPGIVASAVTGGGGGATSSEAERKPFGHNVRFNFESEEAVRRALESSRPIDSGSDANDRNGGGPAAAAPAASGAAAAAQNGAAGHAASGDAVDAGWLKVQFERAFPRAQPDELVRMCTGERCAMFLSCGAFRCAKPRCV